MLLNNFNSRSCNLSEPAGVKSKGIDNTDNTGDQMKEILNYNRNSTTILPSSSLRKGIAGLKSYR